MDIILQKFASSNEYQSLVTGLNNDLSEQLVTGVSGSIKHILIATIFKEENRPILIITHNLLNAQKIYDDLTELIGTEKVLLYPDNQMAYVDIDAQSPETLGQRIKFLQSLVYKKSGIYIVPYSGINKIICSKEDFTKAIITIEVGQTIDIENFIKKLINIGYERTELVTKAGEICVRGGIVDIYPMTEDNPIRIELFDDEIDSIRIFDNISQRSLSNLSSITITPVREMIINEDQFELAELQLKALMKEYMYSVKDEHHKEKLLENISWEIEQLNQKVYFSGISKYTELMNNKYSTLLDYINEEHIIIFDEVKRVYESAKVDEEEIIEWKKSLLEQARYLPQLKIYNTYEDVMMSINNQVIYLSTLLRKTPNTSPQNIININCYNMQNFHGQINYLKTEMERWGNNKTHIIFLAADKERAKRLQRVLEDYGVDINIVSEATQVLPQNPVIIIGNLQTGFELPSIHLSVITEIEIFSNKPKKSKTVKKETSHERIKSYTDLKIGDYVVHVNHGIGVYIGIETLVINDINKDYLHLKYANNDKLYVPIEQIDLVQKYVGKEGLKPKIYSLSGNEWNRVKNKVKSSVKDIALDLIKLYSERESLKGYPFQPDSEYHSEFAALFQYNETIDQLKAIEDIRQDMEKEKPMDRLLCGDVGYGKTEVAIRAAFKAVFSGKQVAILVPTTILAQQHFSTFSERFIDYPIKVEVISRFRTKNEQKKIISELKDGSVDIVIGTHRILSKDVSFKDLGLLIIDEEQRFGVRHKERIKELRINVDVLTLTATPIPRTLHMSMLGVRDFSIIETPPENRFPIQTYVLEYNNVLVREAIEREIARGGQVYFLYNQVKSIHQMANQIKTLIPEAEVAVAHGQMAESELENIMFNFLEGEYDILVSTTIIETGVDIPNVNTLIIYDADKMGLSQLYQLRGRVGRSNRIAYAYFTYQRDKVLTEVAENRLSAIKEFTELGSGYKIAMRDLAIRGAGNLLGAQQHGFIASVGFDLYNQLLKDTITELKGGEKEKVKFEPQIELEIEAYIPNEYINDSIQKIEIYKKFTNIRNEEELSDLKDELLDRFGDFSQPINNLIMISNIKSYAYKYKIESILQKKNEIIITPSFSQNKIIDGYKLFKLTNEFNHRIKLSSARQITITINKKGLNPEETVSLIADFLKRYQEILIKGEKVNEK